MNTLMNIVLSLCLVVASPLAMATNHGACHGSDQHSHHCSAPVTSAVVADEHASHDMGGDHAAHATATTHSCHDTECSGDCADGQCTDEQCQKHCASMGCTDGQHCAHMNASAHVGHNGECEACDKATCEAGDCEKQCHAPSDDAEGMLQK